MYLKHIKVCISVVWLPSHKLCLVWDQIAMCKFSQDISCYIIPNYSRRTVAIQNNKSMRIISNI